MQQWFDQDQTNIKPVHSSDSKFHTVPRSSKEMDKLILKTFTVEAETITGQHICVSGNCSTLGDWVPNKAFVLNNTNVIRIRKNRKYCVWTGSVHLPPEKEIFFRYFMAYIVEPDGEFVTQRHIFVHSWESQQEPRRVQNEALTSSSENALQSDMYGMYDKKQISKGFLTTECAIQFKLFDTPITFWNSKLQSKLNFVSVKMTPVSLSKLSADSGETSPNTSSCILEDSSSQGTDYIEKQFGWPYVECMDIPGGHSFKHQNQFGTIVNENTFHLFQTKMYNFSCVGYLFDLYLHKESSDEPPFHIGFTHILPSNMKYSNGIIISPITSVRHKPIGELKIDYLIIKPTKDINCTLEQLKLTDWKSSDVPLDIGHRGSGSSFKQILSDSCSHIRENTIASLKEAANKGADLVEFDVQLTKDLVPIINHDFVVSMATKSKTNLLAEEVEMVQIPLKDFSFEQLQKLKIYHVKEPYTLSETHFLNDDRYDYQPFPKLEKAFTDVDTNVGFNIELKWTMKLQDGTYELDNPFDMNLFVDTILKTTFELAGSRSIVFSCFHPDVCTMLKMKQNRYPILFLTQGVTIRYPSYADPRCHSIQNAVYHATCHDLLGVNVHSEDLLRDPLQIDIVKKAGLALFCWGDDNNCKDVANKFKKLGVNAVIYDKLDKTELLKKKMPCPKNPDVFIANNYCDQNDILLSNQQSLKDDPHLREDNDKDNNRYFMDVGKASFQNQCSSTETLWNEKKNNSKSPSRKQRFECIDATLEPDVKPTKPKKSKADI